MLSVFYRLLGGIFGEFGQRFLFILLNKIGSENKYILSILPTFLSTPFKIQINM